MYKNQAKFDFKNPIIESLLNQIDSSKITISSIKNTLEQAPNPKDVELQESLNKLKDYNNIAPNLRSLPPNLPPNFPNIDNNNNNNGNNNNDNDDDDNNNNNNNNNSNNDDKGFPTTDQFFLYPSRMPPSSDFKLPPFLSRPSSLIDTSDGLIGELEKTEEIKLDENRQDLFPDSDNVFKQTVEDNISLKEEDDVSAH